MNNPPTWHTRAVEQLSQIFANEPDARAFVLSGSLAAGKSQVDIWSDVDAKIILGDHAIDRYYASTDWLVPFGRLIGVERHAGVFTKTLRIRLEDFKRFDLVFIPESALQHSSFLTSNPFLPPYTVVWSRLPDLEARLASLPLPAPYQDVAPAELERIVDEFWLKAAIAITKVARSDSLIGLHLAFDLARDCLVLQMIRRDREQRTTIHRVGGWGNEFVTRFSLKSREKAHTEILSLVRQSCEAFDQLASELVPGYETRGSLLVPTLELAEEVCRVRAIAGQ